MKDGKLLYLINEKFFLSNVLHIWTDYFTDEGRLKMNPSS